MNHYPHHIGDFAKDTLGFNQGAIGAYRLLMDAYYANEEAPAAEEVYVIGRATTPAERKNVERALTKFELRDGHYFHKRVEEELAAYRTRADTARENGKKGGRGQKPVDKKPTKNPEGTQRVTGSDTQNEPTGNPAGGPSGQLTSNHKPEELQKQNQKRYGDNYIPDSVGTAARAALDSLKARAEPLTVDEAKITSDDDTPAGKLAAVCYANGIRANAFHPLIVEWARERVTIEQVKHAIATAKQRKGDAKIPLAYLDPIIHDEAKGGTAKASEVAAGHATSRARVDRTQAMLAEQRGHQREPMPADIAEKFVKHGASE